MRTPNELKEILSSSIEQLSQSSKIKEVEGARNRVVEGLRKYLAGIDDASNKGELLWLGIVGQMKAGKSSFLNAWLFNGEQVLPTAATPMTAGLTTLRYTNGKNRMQICYYSQEDWDFIKEEAAQYKELRDSLLDEMPGLKGKETQIADLMSQRATESQRSSAEIVDMVTTEAAAKIGSQDIEIEFDNIVDLHSMMKDLVGAHGTYTSVVSMLNIYLKDERIKGLCIVDTPGVNDPVVSREAKTNEFLAKCHGVFMLSRAERAMDNKDVTFMDQRLNSVGVNTIFFIESQFDDLLRNNAQYKEFTLAEAIADVQNKHAIHFNRQKQNLQSVTANALCGHIYSSAIAYTILLKLKEVDFDEAKAALDETEFYVLRSLRESFPTDFADRWSTADSLSQLANFKAIEDVVKNDFLNNAKTIKRNKFKLYFEGQNKEVQRILDNAIGSIQAELDFFNSTNLDLLNKQIQALKDSSDSVISPLQRVIDAQAKRLQSDWKAIREKALTKRDIRVENTEMATSYISKSYTRISTKLKWTKSGSISVSVVNRESTKERQRLAMEKFHKYIAEEWDKMFTNFITKMLDEMVTRLQNLDPVLARSSMTLSNIAKDTFEVKLQDYAMLTLSELLISGIKKMKNFIDETIHTSFNTSLGKMLESDADKKIEEQASEKLKAVRAGLENYDNNFMNSIIREGDASVKKIVEILREMRDRIDIHLSESINNILREKTEQLEDKNRIMTELSETLKCMNIIKNKINGN